MEGISQMSKKPYGNTKTIKVQIQNCIKKARKNYLQKTISLLFLPENSEVLNHMPSKVHQVVVFVFIQYWAVQDIKKNLELQVVVFMEDEVQDD